MRTSTTLAVLAFGALGAFALPSPSPAPFWDFFSSPKQNNSWDGLRASSPGSNSLVGACGVPYDRGSHVACVRPSRKDECGKTIRGYGQEAGGERKSEEVRVVEVCGWTGGGGEDKVLVPEHMQQHLGWLKGEDTKQADAPKEEPKQA